MRVGRRRKKTQPSISRGSQPITFLKPSARSAASSTATLSIACASMTTASAGVPLASFAAGFIARLRAVLLVPSVVKTRSCPSHHPETAIRCGLPPTSAVASQNCPCSSSTAITSRLRVAVSLGGGVDVIAPILTSRRKMAGAVETVAFEGHLPAVLGAEAVDERRRRPHDTDTLDALLQ